MDQNCSVQVYLDISALNICTQPNHSVPRTNVPNVQHIVINTCMFITKLSSKQHLPGGPIAATSCMSISLSGTTSFKSYQVQWSNHCRRSSIGGWAPNVSNIGMFMSSTNTIWWKVGKKRFKFALSHKNDFKEFHLRKINHDLATLRYCNDSSFSNWQVWTNSVRVYPVSHFDRNVSTYYHIMVWSQLFCFFIWRY